MPRSGPRQIYKYSKEFKLAAVRLSHVLGMQVKAVATARGIGGGPRAVRRVPEHGE